MNNKAVAKEIREEILVKVHEGKRVNELANQYGISNRTIYAWLTKETGGSSSIALENARLRRETSQLKQIIGELMLEKSRGKKDRHD